MRFQIRCIFTDLNLCVDQIIFLSLVVRPKVAIAKQRGRPSFEILSHLPLGHYFVSDCQVQFLIDSYLGQISFFVQIAFLLV